MQTNAISGRSWSAPKAAFAYLLVVPFLYPLIFLVATAMRKSDAYNKTPLGFSGFPTLSHLRYAWGAGSLGQGVINSLIAVPIGVVVCCTVSSMAAFWFFRHRGRIAKTLLSLILIGWIVPFAVYLVPFYIEMVRLNLTDNLFMLGFAYGALSTPFGIYFVLAYLRQAVPMELLEAASVDGASIGRQFMRIVVPLARPAIGTLAALSFVGMWGDVLLSVVLLGSDPSKFTIVLSANALVGQTVSASGSVNTVQTVAAATVISLVPMLGVVYFAQRAIVRGFSAGALK